MVTQKDSLPALTAAIEHCRTLWAFFLTYTVTVAILAGSTSHEALLRLSPLQLPLFNLGVPLLLFFTVTPAFLVALHCDMLLRLHDIRVRAARLTFTENLRIYLPVLDYFTTGSNLISDRRERVLLRLISTLTIFVLPTLVLLFIQRQFLPYHSAGVVWWHRAMVILDLAGMLYIHFGLSPWETRSRRRNIAYAASGLVVLLAVFVMAFPGEPQDFLWPRVKAGLDPAEKYGIARSLYLPNRHLAAKEPAPEIVAAFEARLGGKFERDEEDQALNAQDARSLAERLYGEPMDFKDRNLAYADLTNTKLVGADFSGANLEGASFANSQLTVAAFDNALATSADFAGSNLRGSVFSHADLTTAQFAEADLQGTTIADTRADGANFSSADLTLASVRVTSLSAASFEDARLEGARFYDVALPGANMRRVHVLQGRIWYSDLRAADFTAAELAGPTLIADDMSYATLAITPAADSYVTPQTGTADGEESALKRVQGARLRDSYLKAFSLAHTAGRFTSRFDYEGKFDEGPPCCMKDVYKPSGYIKMNDAALKEFQLWKEVKWPHLNATDFTQRRVAALEAMACEGKPEVHLVIENISGHYPVPIDRVAFVRGLGGGLFTSSSNRIFGVDNVSFDPDQLALAKALVTKPCFRSKLSDNMLQVLLAAIDGTKKLSERLRRKGYR